MNVARPYAEAAFEAAGGPDEAVLLAGELDAAVGLLSGEPDLASFLAHPGVSLEAKREVIRRVLGPREEGQERSRTSELALNLFQILIDKHRFGELSAVAAALRARIDDALGTGEARLEASRPLTDVETEAVIAALERRTGKRVRVVSEVRPELIGGMRVAFGDRVFDASIRGQLDALRHRLSGRN